MDCFAGTGSSAVACMRSKRIFYGCDEDNVIAEAASNRIINEVKLLFKTSIILFYFILINN